MGRIDTDLCVIGAGSGGLSVAAGAVQMAARVVLIEGGEMGGDCLNAGCVPSKALIAAAKAAEVQRRGFQGVAGQEPRIDFAAVKDHVAAVIAEIAPVSLKFVSSRKGLQLAWDAIEEIIGKFSSTSKKAGDINEESL